MVRHVVFLATLAALAVPPAPALSQITCGPREAFLKQITGKYKESRTAIAITIDRQGLYEVWVSATGTFTITLTRARSDVACIVLAGKEWFAVLPPVKPGKDL